GRRVVDRIRHVDADGVAAPGGVIAGGVDRARLERVDAVGVDDRRAAVGDRAAVDAPLHLGQARAVVGAGEVEAQRVGTPGGARDGTRVGRVDRVDLQRMRGPAARLTGGVEHAVV